MRANILQEQRRGGGGGGDLHALLVIVKQELFIRGEKNITMSHEQMICPTYVECVVRMTQMCNGYGRF